MQENNLKVQCESNSFPEPALDPAEIQAEIEAAHLAELLKLSDLAFIFLTAAGGNTAEAEQRLDDFIDLLCEGGVLSTWRYRILLDRVREGL